MPIDEAAPIFRVTTHVLGGPGGPQVQTFAPVDGGQKRYVAPSVIRTPQGDLPLWVTINATSLRQAFERAGQAVQAAHEKVLAEARSQIVVPRLNGRLDRPEAGGH